MNQYLIEFHNVPHELRLYLEEIKVYGEIRHTTDKMPQYVWLESFWDLDIVEGAMGVKKVYPKRHNSTPLSVTHNRGWTELLGTKWEANPV
jgi:hypothetical protein